MSVRALLQQCSVESQRSEMKLDNSRTIYKVIVDILAVSLFSVVDLVWMSDHISEPCILRHMCACHWLSARVHR